MDVQQIALGAAGGFAAGWLAGHLLGRRVRAGRAWRYWVLNIVALGIGASLNLAGLDQGKTWLWVGGIAFTVSSLSGLKYGRSVTTGRGSLQPPAERDQGPPSLWDD